MSLTKEYVITEISASPDGSPSVSFTSMNDMLKNFGNVISKQMMGSFATIIKITLNEYEKCDFKVGDRVSLEINKTISGF